MSYHAPIAKINPINDNPLVSFQCTRTTDTFRYTINDNVILIEHRLFDPIAVTLNGKSTNFETIVKTCFTHVYHGPAHIICDNTNCTKYLPPTARRIIYRMKQYRETPHISFNPDTEELYYFINNFYSKYALSDVTFYKYWTPVFYAAGCTQVATHLLLQEFDINSQRAFTSGMAHDITLYSLRENTARTGVIVDIHKPEPDFLIKRFSNALFATWEQYRNYTSYGRYSLDLIASVFMRHIHDRDAEGYSLGIPFPVTSFLLAAAQPAFDEIINALTGEAYKNKYLLLTNKEITPDNFRLFMEDRPNLKDKYHISEMTYADDMTFEVLYSEFFTQNAAEDWRKLTLNYSSICRLILDVSAYDISQPMDRSYLEEMTGQKAISSAIKRGDLIKYRNPKNRVQFLYEFSKPFQEKVNDWIKFKEKNKHADKGTALRWYSENYSGLSSQTAAPPQPIKKKHYRTNTIMNKNIREIKQEVSF